MESIMVKGTNWIKGLALLGMLVAMVGMLAIAPAASASTAICTSDLTGKIEVFVVDGVKGNVVPRATVVVYNTSGEVLQKGTTDASGNFTTEICTGTYKVKIFGDNYKEFGQYVTVSYEQPATVKAALQPNSPRLNSR